MRLLFRQRFFSWSDSYDIDFTGRHVEGSVLERNYSITDEDGNAVTVKGTDGTVYVEGESSYTVTVASYSDTADLSGASSTTQWSDYETEKPEALA